MLWIRPSERSAIYGKQATGCSEGSEERKKYAKLALAELESFIELLNSQDEETNMNILYSKATMTAMTDQPEKTVKIADEVLLLNEKHPGNMDLDKVDYTKCSLAEAYVALGKWKEAAKIYKTLYNTYLQSGGHNALVLMGLARTKYELGKYDEAIEIGSVAIKEFRQYHGVHKYVALAHKAKGDIDEAKKTMSRAILYEYQWNKDNVQTNKELWLELNNM